MCIDDRVLDVRQLYWCVRALSLFLRKQNAGLFLWFKFHRRFFFLVKCEICFNTKRFSVYIDSCNKYGVSNKLNRKMYNNICQMLPTISSHFLKSLSGSNSIILVGFNRNINTQLLIVFADMLLSVT